MKTGPKTKPTKLKKLEGNPGKRPLPVNELQVDPGIPARPTFLKGAAKKEWDRVAPELFRLGVLTKIDRAALAAYCQAYGRWEEAERKVKKDGYLFETSNGNLIQNPMLSVANKALELMHKFLTEFGMTPSSRVKVSGEISGQIMKPKTPMEKILEGTREISN